MVYDFNLEAILQKGGTLFALVLVVILLLVNIGLQMKKLDGNARKKHK